VSFIFKFHICNKVDNFTWTLVVVYGAAHVKHKTDFLRELASLAKVRVGLIIIGLSYSILSTTT
jgi:hypothetical protein